MQLLSQRSIAASNAVLDCSFCCSASAAVLSCSFCRSGRLLVELPGGGWASRGAVSPVPSGERRRRRRPSHERATSVRIRCTCATVFGRRPKRSLCDTLPKIPAGPEAELLLSAQVRMVKNSGNDRNSGNGVCARAALSRTQSGDCRRRPWNPSQEGRAAPPRRAAGPAGRQSASAATAAARGCAGTLPLPER